MTPLQFDNIIEFYLKIIAIAGSVIGILFIVIGFLLAWWMTRNEKDKEVISKNQESTTKEFTKMASGLKDAINNFGSQLKLFETLTTKDLDLQKEIIRDHGEVLIVHADHLQKHESKFHDVDRDLEELGKHCKEHTDKNPIE